MANERELIIGAFVTALGKVPGIKLVSRDFRRVIVGAVSEYPCAFVVDLGDSVMRSDSRPWQSHRRTLRIGIVIVYQGSTEALTPSEAATFLRACKKALYTDLRTNTTIDAFFETETSAMGFSELSPRIVFQGCQFEILYIEDIPSLLT